MSIVGDFLIYESTTRSLQTLVRYETRRQQTTVQQVMDDCSSADETEQHDTHRLPDYSSLSPDSPIHDEDHPIYATPHDADHLNGATPHEADHLNGATPHDADHLNHGPTHDIPAVGAASPNKSIAARRNHDTVECAGTDGDYRDTKMEVDRKSPSRSTEHHRRPVLLDAPSTGAQSPKPVAVVSPMRPSVSGAAPDRDRDRPRSSSSKSPHFTVCQTSQALCSGDFTSSPRPWPVVEGTSMAARHRSDLRPLPADLLPRSQAADVCFESSRQEQHPRKLNRVPTTPLDELDVLRQSNFFYGHLSRSKVKAKLRQSEAGTFLVRYSSDSKFQFALSLKTPNGVTSVRLARNPDGLIRLDCDPGQADRMPVFPSVLDLVVNYVRDETGRRPCRSHCIYLEGEGLSETVLDLHRPLEESPATLRHLCRRRINGLVPLHRRSDLLEALTHVAREETRKIVDYLEAYPYRI